MASISANDVLTGNKQNLYGQFNMDPKGNNEIGAWLRRLAQLSGYGAAQGLAFQSGLEPQRQGAISGLVNAFDPANMRANAAAAGQGILNQGTQQGQVNASALGRLGASAGTQLGAVTAAQNDATNLRNQLLLQANSPAAQMQALQGQLAAIGQAGGPGLEQLLAMFGPIEQRTQQNAADKARGGLGGFGGILGAALGQTLPGLNFGRQATPGSVTSAADLARFGIGGGLAGAYGGR